VGQRGFWQRYVGFAGVSFYFILFEGLRVQLEGNCVYEEQTYGRASPPTSPRTVSSAVRPSFSMMCRFWASSSVFEVAFRPGIALGIASCALRRSVAAGCEASLLADSTLGGELRRDFSEVFVSVVLGVSLWRRTMPPPVWKPLPLGVAS